MCHECYQHKSSNQFLYKVDLYWLGNNSFITSQVFKFAPLLAKVITFIYISYNFTFHQRYV